MKIENIEIESSLQKVKELLETDKTVSPSLRAGIELLLTLINLLVNRLGLNSSNSHKPPSSDSNREKKEKKPSKIRAGGQKGHIGKTLQPVDDPDEIEELSIKRSSLPKGNYRQVGYESRQVFDLDITVVVKEYRGEILKDQNGNSFVADFPDGVTNRVQYGKGVKAHAVYLSKYQLLPYKRIEEYFADQIGLPLSAGTICNFNQKCYVLLESFEDTLRKTMIDSKILHADETSINIGGNRHWLHGNSNNQWTYLYPHKKRGTEAMDEMGVLPLYEGKLCHDHWKPYYKYKKISHLLCNAHHLRELERVWEQEKQEWGKIMMNFLLELNQVVKDSGGMLKQILADKKRERYREILKEGEKECLPPKPPPDGKKKRGRLKRSKSRNLLERLQAYENDVLGFMLEKDSPFTNNLGERDIRMTKVQQKISGCFRSIEGARNFCRIRSYISSAKKQKFSASFALNAIFEGKDIFLKNSGG